PDEGQDTQGMPAVTAVEVPATEKVDLPVAGSKTGTSKPDAGVSKTAVSGRYAVQVASLASEANARRLQSDLEARGFNVISDRLAADVGRLSRVRVGRFEAEADAAAAVKQGKSQVDGVSPRLVGLDPAAAQSLSPSDPLVRWVVQ